MKYKEPPEWHDCYPWTRPNPGLFIFTVDQSVDMRVDYSDFKNRSEFAADLVNRSIYQTISKNYSGRAPKNNCYITVLGYASQVKVLCEGWLSDLCESPKRIFSIVRKIPDGEGGMIDIEEEMPIWVDPKINDNNANLSILSDEVQKRVNNWSKDKRTVPIVINLTAGNHADRDVHKFELKDCLICNVLCKPDKEISDDDRLYWETHSARHLPATIKDAMKRCGYDIRSLFLEASMLYAFVSAPFYYQAQASLHYDIM